jgi:hypothetical protein
MDDLRATDDNLPRIDYLDADLQRSTMAMVACYTHILLDKNEGPNDLRRYQTKGNTQQPNTTLIRQ